MKKWILPTTAVVLVLALVLVIVGSIRQPGSVQLRNVSEIRSINDIYDGPEYTLPELQPDNPVRKTAESELAIDVKNAVIKARDTNDKSLDRKYVVNLLATSIETPPEEPWKNSVVSLFESMLRPPVDPIRVTFASWRARLGKVIGENDCYTLGMRVIKNEGFTLAEAKQILSNTEWEIPTTQ